MATYPGRRAALPAAVRSLEHQLDHLYVCCNDYTAKPFKDSDRVSYVIPSKDFKDVGKFVFPSSGEDFVFLVDDDIIYPENYTAQMQSSLEGYRAIEAIVGLHGVTYPDLYNGAVRARSVNVFNRLLADDVFVNQLGTGTVCCFGWQMPSLEFMDGSQRFVDVRFAIHAYRSKFPMVCMAREASWLREFDETDETSIFSEFTGSWPPNVVRECQEIAGFSKLPSLGSATSYIQQVRAISV